MDTQMHTYIYTHEREGLLNPVTVGLKETLWYFRLEHTVGHGEAKRVPLLPYSVTMGLGGSRETHGYLIQSQWGYCVFEGTQ